jgi:general secretion pathway protein K
VNLSTSTRLIDSLVDWVDSDSLTQPQGAEEEDYTKRKRMGPRNGPFESIDELKKVIGWEEMAKEAALGPQGVVNPLKKFTIYGSGKLSLLTADQDVIEIVLDLQPGAATNFMQVRNGADQQAGTPDDLVNTGLLPGVNPAVLAERTTNGGGDLWRVTSTGYVGEAKRTVVALISRNPPQIKARWTEEEDRP